MSHIPTPVDVASDLLRCVNASISSDGFENISYKHFLSTALKTLPEVQNKISKQNMLLLEMRLKKAVDDSRNKNKRREDLLMASTILLHS